MCDHLIRPVRSALAKVAVVLHFVDHNVA